MEDALKLLTCHFLKCGWKSYIVKQWWTLVFCVRTGVNFINVKRTNFSYERRFGSFYYVHVNRKKLPKWRSYEKRVRLTLMKLSYRRSTRRTRGWPASTVATTTSARTTSRLTFDPRTLRTRPPRPGVTSSSVSCAAKRTELGAIWLITWGFVTGSCRGTICPRTGKKWIWIVWNWSWPVLFRY